MGCVCCGYIIPDGDSVRYCESCANQDEWHCETCMKSVTKAEAGQHYDKGCTVFPW